MNETTVNNTPLISYHAWDRSVRVFHWINVIAIIGLISIGLIILNNKSFGVSADGKVLLKTIHTYIGYVFVLNLSWRIIWGFIGGKTSRWKAILPFANGYTNGYKSAVENYLQGFKKNNAPAYLGHNPVSRLMVTFLFLLLSSQAITGLVLAGTDLYMPPFGNQIAEWIALPAEDGGQLLELKPGSKDGVDPEAYKEMRAFRKPFITVHEYGFYILGLAIVLHIAGVVVTEVKERNGLVSAMFTGDKVFSKKPIDLDDDDS